MNIITKKAISKIEVEIEKDLVKSSATKFQEFKPLTWVFIDLGNHLGYDKLVFEDRVAKAMDFYLQYKQELKSDMKLLSEIIYSDELAVDAPIKCINTILAIDEIIETGSTNAVIGMDATASGIAIVSILTGDISGCKYTNSLESNVRFDPYTALHKMISSKINGLSTDDIDYDDIKALMDLTRKDNKSVLMQYLYCGDKTLNEKYGDLTHVFEEGVKNTFPSVWAMRKQTIQYLSETTNNSHEWVLPDGTKCRLKVKAKHSFYVEVKLGDEYVELVNHKELHDHNDGYRGLLAGIIQSFDAMVARETILRCNYNSSQVTRAIAKLEADGVEPNIGFASMNWLSNIDNLSDDNKSALLGLLKEVITYNPFEVFTVHDEFLCSPVHMNRMRLHYKNFMSELALGNFLENVWLQITGNGFDDKFKPYLTCSDETKLDLAYTIRNKFNYGLC